MATVTTPTPERVLLENVDWRTYSQLLHALGERPRLRLTYDGGTLEVLMSPLLEHDWDADFVGRFVVVLTEELALPIKSGGSVTLRRRRQQRGLEPDRCYWITSEPRVRGRRTLDLRVDPPPDLAIEVDVTHSSLDRLGIYASLGIPEVWQLDGPALVFHLLGPGGTYAAGAKSLAFPGLAPGNLLPFLNRRAQLDDNTVMRQFRTWVQLRIAANWQ